MSQEKKQVKGDGSGFLAVVLAVVSPTILSLLLLLSLHLLKGDGDA